MLCRLWYSLNQIFCEWGNMFDAPAKSSDTNKHPHCRDHTDCYGDERTRGAIRSSKAKLPTTITNYPGIRRSNETKYEHTDNGFSYHQYSGNFDSNPNFKRYSNHI